MVNLHDRLGSIGLDLEERVFEQPGLHALRHPLVGELPVLPTPDQPRQELQEDAAEGPDVDGPGQGLEEVELGWAVRPLYLLPREVRLADVAVDVSGPEVR